MVRSVTPGTSNAFCAGTAKCGRTPQGGSEERKRVLLLLLLLLLLLALSFDMTLFWLTVKVLQRG